MPPTTLIIPHRLPAFLESLMSLKNWCSIYARYSKISSIRFCGIFPNLKQNFIAYSPDCIFEIHQLWQSGISRVYSNCCCSCWFEPEIMKIGQSSHKMYSNNIVNFQECTAILNSCTRKSGNLLKSPRNCTNVSVIAWLELEPVYYNAAVQHFSLISAYSPRRIRPSKRTPKIFWDFQIKTDH